MGNLNHKQDVLGIGNCILLLILILVPSMSISALAQECGPNLSLKVVDLYGHVTRLRCAYIGYDSSRDSLECVTDESSRLNVDIYRIKKISLLTNWDGEPSFLSNTPSVLAIVQLKDGQSKRVYITDPSRYVVGYSSWGKQFFDLIDIQTVEFESKQEK